MGKSQIEGTPPQIIAEDEVEDYNVDPSNTAQLGVSGLGVTIGMTPPITELANQMAQQISERYMGGMVVMSPPENFHVEVAHQPTYWDIDTRVQYSGLNVQIVLRFIDMGLNKLIPLTDAEEDAMYRHRDHQNRLEHEFEEANRDRLFESLSTVFYPHYTKFVHGVEQTDLNTPRFNGKYLLPEPPCELCQYYRKLLKQTKEIPLDTRMYISKHGILDIDFKILL
jgi:hypothetical protein